MPRIDRYENVATRYEGTKLVIEIETDPAKVDIAPSASGKTDVIATSGGAVDLGRGVKLNLTLYKNR